MSVWSEIVTILRFCYDLWEMPAMPVQLPFPFHTSKHAVFRYPSISMEWTGGLSAIVLFHFQIIPASCEQGLIDHTARKESWLLFVAKETGFEKKKTILDLIRFSFISDLIYTSLCDTVGFETDIP